MFELKKWEPLRDLASFQREMQKDMEDFFRRTFGNTSFFRRESREWYPSIDCFIKNNQFVVHADLPGVDPKDVDISVTGNMLTIKGERKAEYDEKKEGYLYHESSYGTFERTLELPEGVDTNKVHATYKKGMLELTMPVKAEALPKKVKIEAEEAKKAA